MYRLMLIRLHTGQIVGPEADIQRGFTWQGRSRPRKRGDSEGCGGERGM